MWFIHMHGTVYYAWWFFMHMQLQQIIHLSTLNALCITIICTWKTKFNKLIEQEGLHARVSIEVFCQRNGLSCQVCSLNIHTPVWLNISNMRVQILKESICRNIVWWPPPPLFFYCLFYMCSRCQGSIWLSM